MTAVFMLLGPNLGAGDKKEKAKKAEDIVVESELIKNDVKDKSTNRICKTFTFKMEKDKTYQLECGSAAFRPYLRLEDPNAQQVATDIARAVNVDAVIMYRSPKTADYTIVVTSITINAVGKFKLTVKELGADFGKPIELKMEKGEAKFTGNLTKADPRRGNKIHKLFLVPLEEGKTYQIDQVSKMDSYLFLEDPDGKLLAQDDDGGGFPNARITYKAAKKGNYRIVATTLGGQDTGEFTLTVRQTDK
jgi:hypothetical protein